MSIPLEEMEKTKRETASGNDGPDEHRMPEIGYFYLSQQISNLTQMHNEFRGNTELRFDSLRQELKADMKGLRDELKSDMSSLRGELKGDISSLREDLKGDISSLKGELKGDITELKAEFNNMKTWYIGTVVGIIGVIIALIGLILK